MNLWTGAHVWQGPGIDEVLVETIVVYKIGEKKSPDGDKHTYHR